MSYKIKDAEYLIAKRSTTVVVDVRQDVEICVQAHNDSKTIPPYLSITIDDITIEINKTDARRLMWEIERVMGEDPGCDGCPRLEGEE